MPPIRFRMTEEALKALLQGDMVSIPYADHTEVQFFMEDIGIHKIEAVCKESIDAVKKKLSEA